MSKNLSGFLCMSCFGAEEIRFALISAAKLPMIPKESKNHGPELVFLGTFMVERTGSISEFLRYIKHIMSLKHSLIYIHMIIYIIYIIYIYISIYIYVYMVHIF